MQEHDNPEDKKAIAEHLLRQQPPTRTHLLPSIWEGLQSEATLLGWSRLPPGTLMGEVAESCSA